MADIKVINFNNEEMCRFIKEFNPTKHKYMLDENSAHYGEALKYDSLNKSLNLKKNLIPNLIRNADLIYGNAQQSIDYGQIYKEVLEKFLLNFVGIPDLGSLFDAQFMDFEWNMHANLDFSEHRNSYYRDHFIHQVRNLFMTFKLIEENHFENNKEESYIFDCVKHALTSSTRSKVTQYFKNRSNAWINDLENNNKLCTLLSKISDEKTGFFTSKREEYYKDYFCGYVIKGALIISCLFHDIGYPVAYYLSVKERLINFIPAVYSIMGVNNFDFNYIYSLLSESVLFKFVGKDILYKRFSENDHGTISAMLLGVFFYKTGLIHSLSIEKQTAVELGMLAIYNHTLSLKKVRPSSNTTFTEIVFTLNPISYLLKWCDDMQEWEREYFEIASVSNLLFCSDCKMPLRKALIDPTEFFTVNGIAFNVNATTDLNRDPAFFRKFFNYRCMCPDPQNHFRFTKRDDFNRRSLLQIKACDNLSIEFNYTKKFILIDFQYNTYKLLRLSNIHPSFIEKRQKEISQIKKFISRQQFANETGGYQFISIKHNLSPNPIYLKMLIIKDFLNELQKYLQSNPQTDFDKLLEINKLYIQLLSPINQGRYRIKIILSKVAKSLIEFSYGVKKQSNSYYYNVLLNNCQKYVAMAVYQAIAVKMNGKPNNSIRQIFKNYIGSYDDNDTREILINAALDKIDSYIAPDKIQPCIDTEKYVKDTDAKDLLFTVVQDYCDSNNEINLISQTKNEEMTYYTDLYMYEKLSYQTELFKKNGAV